MGIGGRPAGGRGGEPSEAGNEGLGDPLSSCGFGFVVAVEEPGPGRWRLVRARGVREVVGELGSLDSTSTGTGASSG